MYPFKLLVINRHVQTGVSPVWSVLVHRCSVQFKTCRQLLNGLWWNKWTGHNMKKSIFLSFSSHSNIIPLAQVAVKAYNVNRCCELTEVWKPKLGHIQTKCSLGSDVQHPVQSESTPNCFIWAATSGEHRRSVLSAAVKPAHVPSVKKSKIIESLQNESCRKMFFVGLLP